MNVQRFTNFDRGLVTDRPSDQLPVNALASCANIEILPQAGFRACRGRVRHEAVTSATGTRNLGWYQGGTDAFGQIVAAQGTAVRVSTTSTQNTYSALDTTVHATNPVRMAQYGDSLYLVDGNGPVKRWKGFDSSVSAWTEVTSTYFGQVGPRAICVATSGAVWAADYTNNCVNKYTVGTPWTFVAAYDGDSGTGARTYQPIGLCEVEIAAVKYIAVLNQSVTTAPQDKFIVLLKESDGSYYDSFCVSGTTDAANVLEHPQGIAATTGNLLHVVDLVYSPAKARVKVLTSAGVYQSNYGAFGTADGQFQSPTGISIATTATIEYAYVLDNSPQRVSKFNAATHAFVKTWGSSGTLNGQFTLPVSIAASTTQVAVLDTVQDRVQTFTPDGVFVSTSGSSGLGTGQFYAPRAVGLTATGDVLVGDRYTDVGRIQQRTTTAGTALDVWELTDEPIPAVAPGLSSALVGSLVTLTPGAYDFKYSFLSARYSDFVEGAASPQATINITGNLDTIYVTVYPTSALVSGDIIRIYGRPPTSPDADYYLLAQVTHDGTSSSYSVTIPNTEVDGIVPSGADVLIDYQNRPPSGLTHILAAQSRMIYVSGNRLYISNANDPTRVPYDISFDETGAQYGGWIDVGDGTPITGLAMLNNEVVVFKSSGMWRMVADPNLPSFGLYHLTSDVGCSSQESLAVVEGGLWWFGNRTVWAMGPDLKPVNTGKALQGSLFTSTALHERAFAAYDPSTRFLYMSLPGAGFGSANANAVTWRYQMVPGCWTMLTMQPGGALIHLAGAATPGLYAGDGYVLEGDTAITRLDTTGRMQDLGDAASFTFSAGLANVENPPGVQKDVRSVTILGTGTTAVTPDPVPEPGPDYSGWEPPEGWPALVGPSAGDEKFVGLFVAEDAGSNLASFRVTGACTVDWGDGSALENVDSTVYATHHYDLAEGEQGIITITMQPGEVFVGIDLTPDPEA